MFNARALLAAALGGIGALNLSPETHAAPGKKRRRVDHYRNRLKHTHSGYPGAKLDRKALLNEIGRARTQ